MLFASCSIYILFIYSVKYCRPPQNVIRVCLHIVHIRVPWVWSPPQTWSSVRYVWIPVIYKAGIPCPWHNYCTDLEQNMDTWHTSYAQELSRDLFKPLWNKKVDDNANYILWESTSVISNTITQSGINWLTKKLGSPTRRRTLSWCLPQLVRKQKLTVGQTQSFCHRI